MQLQEAARKAFVSGKKNAGETAGKGEGDEQGKGGDEQGKGGDKDE